MSEPASVHPRTIKIVAALIVDDERRRLLLVRKRGTKAFMQPGGKLEPGETDLQALSREVREELGCGFLLSRAKFLGVFVSAAPNEPGCGGEAALYRVTITEAVIPATEIGEAIWILPSDADEIELAPLTRQFVLPMVCAQ